jgi:hypothetical protein
MRTAFEAWAQRDGHIVRRREDKPDEYLVYETQRRWLIWQAALTHGAQAAAVEGASKFGARKDAEAPKALDQDEAAVRNRVLNEVLDAFSQLDEAAGIEGVLRVIQGLKKKQGVLADQA